MKYVFLVENMKKMILIFPIQPLRETSEELGISKDKISILRELDTFVTPFNSTYIQFFLALLRYLKF